MGKHVIQTGGRKERLEWKGGDAGRPQGWENTDSNRRKKGKVREDGW